MTTRSVNSDDAPQTAPAAPGRWKTWPTIQSKTVRDNCGNMTRTENSAANRRGIVYGVWCAMTFVIPAQLIALGLMTGDLNSKLAVAGVLLIVLHIACLPIWQRRQRQFYSSTLWSREHGIDPKGLKLFNWRGNRKLK